MRGKIKGFGEAERLTPLYPHTLTPILNSQTWCVSAKLWNTPLLIAVAYHKTHNPLNDVIKTIQSFNKP
ncbi:hypothetical protein H6G79_03100 [Anabaena sp. FACHB-83]|nr:hypothetical protein [Anabaena sp. FACHB-83]